MDTTDGPPDLLRYKQYLWRQIEALSPPSPRWRVRSLDTRVLRHEPEALGLDGDGDEDVEPMHGPVARCG